MEITFTLRLPESLDELVKKEAQLERRSKQQQIIRILEERYGVSSDGVTRQAVAKEPEPAHV